MIKDFVSVAQFVGLRYSSSRKLIKGSPCKSLWKKKKAQRVPSLKLFENERVRERLGSGGALWLHRSKDTRRSSARVLPKPSARSFPDRGIQVFAWRA